MAIKDLKRRVLTFAWVFPAVMASLVYRPMMLTLGVAVAVLAADEYHLATRPGYALCASLHHFHPQLRTLCKIAYSTDEKQ
jgi:hypothetical protein